MNIPGIAIFLDFRKAFDTIEWNYLLSALKIFNFGPDILRWIEVIYHNVFSCVLNNGHASPFFSIASRRQARMPTVRSLIRDRYRTSS